MATAVTGLVAVTTLNLFLMQGWFSYLLLFSINFAAFLGYLSREWRSAVF